MKGKLLFCLLFIAIFSSALADFQTPLYRQKLEPVRSFNRIPQRNLREIPYWEFISEPTMLITSFYDYMPGSYNSFPLRIQTDDTGMYVVFHARETASSTRRIYYAYIDMSGNILNLATISSQDIHQGYAGIGIDPVSLNPLVSWHETYTGPIGHLDKFTYDLYHFGSPGLWITPFVLIDETIPTPFPDDDFIWPYVYVGPSPTANKRRVYIVCNNFISHQPSGNPSENVLIGYADFDENDMGIQSQFDWTWNTIPILDNWNQGIPEETRPNQAFAVSDDGKVAYMGYSSAPEGSTVGDQLYVLYNDNYGEGDYEFIAISGEWDIPNPQNQDGSYAFVDPDTNLPHELYMTPYLCNHMNTVFADNNTKLMFLGNMNMMIRPNQWYPGLPMMYLKLYTYDIINQEFSFMDFVDLPGADPYDNNPMLPWDLDEDGQVDEFDPEGYVTWVGGHPIWFHLSDDMFHENQTRLTTNLENGWMAAIWLDGLKNRYVLDGDPNFAGWEEKVEIKISLSADNGIIWSEPITMNSKIDDENFVPQLADMIMCYFYPSDKIIDLGDGFGRIDFFFYNDNSYGSYSSPNTHGQNLGGSLVYMSMKFDFSDLPSGNDQNNFVISPAVLYQNYPNPFNPITNIKFSLEQQTRVQIDIFNVRGQKVKSLLNEVKSAGIHNVVWNGTDDQNKVVASGVYLYKMRTDNSDYTSLKKMILLK